MVSLDQELRNLLKYCKLKLSDSTSVVGAVGGQPAAVNVRLARLPFPEYDGKTNFRAWKVQYNTLSGTVDEDTRKLHLLGALKDRAKTYVDSAMTPTSTCKEIIDLLEARYNCPMAVNYGLLDRVFNSTHLNTRNSTQAHWDSAVGDIMAVKEAGLTLEEALVYYRLHKFQPEMIDRVKAFHKIQFGDKPSVNLKEAVFIMNRLTAEDARLTNDDLIVEKNLKSLTLTAFASIKPVGTNGTKQVGSISSFNTSVNRGDTNQRGQGNFNNYSGTGRGDTSQRGQSNFNNYSGTGRGNTGQRGRGNFNNYYSAGRGARDHAQYNNGTGNNLYCYVCKSNTHNTIRCTVYKTPLEKRAKLLELGFCQECSHPKHDGHCRVRDLCIFCGKGYHYSFICPNVVTTNTIS